METKPSFIGSLLRSKILWLLAVGAAAFMALKYQEDPARYKPVKNTVVPYGSSVESGVRMPDIAPAEGAEQRSFGAPELRWVLGQELLIGTMRPLLKSDYAVTRFNMLVKDFNARTGRYHYVDQDMKQVKKEINLQKKAIEAEARSTAEAWNKQ